MKPLIHAIIFHKTLTAKFFFEGCLQRVKLTVQNEKKITYVCCRYIPGQKFFETLTNPSRLSTSASSCGSLFLSMRKLVRAAISLNR